LFEGDKAVLDRKLDCMCLGLSIVFENNLQIFVFGFVFGLFSKAIVSFTEKNDRF